MNQEERNFDFQGGEIETSVIILAAGYAAALIGLIVWLAG